MGDTYFNVYETTKSAISFGYESKKSLWYQPKVAAKVSNREVKC
jgi:hypothetical protein